MSVSTEDLPIKIGSLLASTFLVGGFLGQGAFGKVVHCVNLYTHARVAIKITKNDPKCILQAIDEIKILNKLKELDPDRCAIARWGGAFFHEGFICLVFELLDQSLLDHIHLRQFNCMSMTEVRPVLHQLITSLLHLEAVGIVHTDIKPDNIMVVDSKQKTLQVKIIDFGHARLASDIVQGKCAQTLCFRAPEVTLGLPYSHPIDMWGLGVTIFELAYGCILFPGEREYEVMKLIVDVLGLPPVYQMQYGKRARRFFTSDGGFGNKKWRIQTPEEHSCLFKDRRRLQFPSLDSLKTMMFFGTEAEEEAHSLFVDLLKEMLMVDKDKRITPLRALEHPFFHLEPPINSCPDMDVEKDTPVAQEEPEESDLEDSKPSPLHLEQIPEEDESAPMQPESVPEKEEPAPMQPESVPEKEEPAPMQPESVPEKEEPAPMQPELVPEKEEPAPMQPESVPEKEEPAPMQPESVPEREEPAPMQPELVPEEEEPAPLQPTEGALKKKKKGAFRRFLKRLRNIFSCFKDNTMD